MGTHVEAFYGADAPVAASGDLIYKEILREDEFKFTPTPEGVKPIPFRVVRTGSSSKKDRTISMSDLVDAFNNKAYDHVQVPLAEKAGADHQDYARVNTGFIEELQVREGDDGKARLVAGMRLTEPDVKGKVERGTIANVSSGIWFDRVRPSDGAAFPVALRHVALTNTPFVDKLKAFGVALSEDGESADELLSVELATPEVVWSPNESFAKLQSNVQAAFQALNESQGGGMGIEDPNAKVFFTRDIWTNKALAEEARSGEVFEVPFKRKKDSVELAPPAEWTAAEQQWIAASEDNPIRVYNQSLAKEAITAAETARAEREQEAETPPVTASEPTRYDLSTPEGRLRKAIADRRADLRSDNQTPGGATSMSGLNTLDLSALDLSDDQKAAIAPFIAETERLRREQQKTAAEAEVQRVMDLGLSEQTGFCKLYRRLLMADDGQPAAVLMSEDGTGAKEEITLTSALKQMIDALPKNAEGKLHLSDQALVTEAGVRPPDKDADEEVEESHDAILADTKRRLGIAD